MSIVKQKIKGNGNKWMDAFRHVQLHMHLHLDIVCFNWNWFNPFHPAAKQFFILKKISGLFSNFNYLSKICTLFYIKDNQSNTLKYKNYIN